MEYFFPEIILQIAEYLNQGLDLCHLGLVSKPFHETSRKNYFWKNCSDFDLFPPKNKKNFIKFLNHIFHYAKYNQWNFLPYHLFLLEKHLDNYKQLPYFGLYIFNLNDILEMTHAANSMELFEILLKINYPLDNLRFTSSDKNLEKYLAERNAFTLNHYLVWTDNVKLYKFFQEKNILSYQTDKITLYPHQYAFFEGKKDFYEIFQKEIEEKYNKDPFLFYKSVENNPEIKEMEFFKTKNLETYLLEAKEKEFEYEDEEIEYPQIIDENDYESPREYKREELKRKHVYERPEYFDFSESDQEEEGIDLNFIFNNSIQDIENEVERFEYIDEFVETIERKPYKEMMTNNNKKRKIEDLPINKRKNLMNSKIGFRSELDELMFHPRHGMMKNTSMDFTFLAKFLLQDYVERMTGQYLLYYERICFDYSIHISDDIEFLLLEHPMKMKNEELFQDIEDTEYEK